jgi:hypothetical protein
MNYVFSLSRIETLRSRHYIFRLSGSGISNGVNTHNGGLESKPLKPPKNIESEVVRRGTCVLPI